MLVRCVYASRAAPDLPQSDLDQILRQSYKNNPARGITGLLFLQDDTFVQAIEGGRDEIGRLLTRLFHDPRHGSIQILQFEDIQERRFGDWTMGQIKAAHINPALILKYCERAALNPFNCSGAATLALLVEIAAAGAIASRSL